MSTSPKKPKPKPQPQPKPSRPPDNRPPTRYWALWLVVGFGFVLGFTLTALVLWKVVTS